MKEQLVETSHVNNRGAHSGAHGGAHDPVGHVVFRPHGLFAAVLEFCRAIEPNIRIDTHADKAPMLGLIECAGFERCGIIYHTDGTPRIAFQLPPDMR